MIGVLGDIVFNVSSSQVKTLSNIQKNRTARIAKHEILGNKPKLEFQGMDLIDMSFDIRLDASLGVNPVMEISRLDLLMSTGEVLDLIIGNTYHGAFLIKYMSEATKYTDRNGITIAAELSINLEEYIYD